MFADLPWVLSGGLMVRILEIEHGVQTPWLTGDVDTVLDIRMVSTATEEAAARLQAAAFVPQRYDEDLTYRFIRDKDIVDVLARPREPQVCGSHTVASTTSFMRVLLHGAARS